MAEQLIPSYYYKQLEKINPNELEQSVKYNINLDEENPMEVLSSFSYYEVLTPEERIEAKKGLAKANISDLLTFIGQNNEKLLDRIEYLFNNGLSVIQWLTNQLNRGKAMVLTFDNLIAEGKKYGQPRDK